MIELSYTGLETEQSLVQSECFDWIVAVSWQTVQESSIT